jgi:molybdopterin-containing oxidoreductase family iron-sulfur binding subunit
MAVDLNACTGCSACVTACQAENNVPIVGKEECALGREMHWLRIDRYEGGDPSNPHSYVQPMPCQQCDNAPCENVCPVNATAHSTDGLNVQVYNRCVGTRYCANNCPYKVRRFNFYHYQGRLLRDSVQELVFNPQVTVRSRGVMEKCTFCLQRINEVKFRMKNAGKEIPDGAVRPACAQACPAQAIVFGNVNDPGSKIARAIKSPLAYRVLEELNVRPNVSYLARVGNPHPDVPPPGEMEKGGHG